MQPWVTGPAEILEHGLTLLESDSDKNRRLALIAIDNSVELAIKTYLGLPRRVTGIEMSRKDYQDISESFPRMLDALERFCGDKLEGIEIGEVEWYHRLRNQLYHQGNGLTVDRDKVRVYSELARLLFRALFGAEISPSTSTNDLVGPFLTAWVRLAKTISLLARGYRDDLAVHGGRLPPPMAVAPALAQLGVLSKKTLRRLEYFWAIRNSVVHGEDDARESLTKKMIAELESINAELEGQI